MNNSIEGLDRIALTHDYLDQYGGAERTLARICDRFRTAPLYTSVYDRPAMRRLGFVEPAQRIVVSFMQTYVPPGILGRVSSATRAAGYAMMPAGALLAGGLATALGIRGALWILTALIAASGLLYLLTPIRQLRDLPRRPARTPSP